MDWKRRRTLPSAAVRRLAIVGGTHGNESNGVHLAKHFIRNPELVKRSSFETEVFLSNLDSIAQNTRYVDEDLNRCYLLKELADDSLAGKNKERKRAREVDALLGPKSSAEPRCDLVIDLHNTTAATDIALMMAPDDEFAHEIGHYLMSLDRGVRVVNWNDQADWPLCPSVGRSGMTFEVGACPWGCVVPDLYQRSMRLLLATLDYVEAHNGLVGGGALKRKEAVMPVYRSIGVAVDFPRDKDGEIVGMVHPDFQGKDFEELREGHDILVGFDGSVQKFKREDHKVPEKHEAVFPVFINEAAYYEKKVAFMLFDKIARKVSVRDE